MLFYKWTKHILRKGSKADYERAFLQLIIHQVACGFYITLLGHRRRELFHFPSPLSAGFCYLALNVDYYGTGELRSTFSFA